MIIFSFQQRDQLGVNVQWVGFDNYKTLFTDEKCDYGVERTAVIASEESLEDKRYRNAVHKIREEDNSYLSTLINSLYYFVGSFIQLGLALFIATLLCSKIVKSISSATGIARNSAVVMYF